MQCVLGGRPGGGRFNLQHQLCPGLTWHNLLVVQGLTYHAVVSTLAENGPLVDSPTTAS